MQLGLPEFDVFSADTIEAACSMLRSYDGNAQFLAGGTDLLVKMKQRRLLPRYLVNLKTIPGLDRIHCADNEVRLGALSTVQAIQNSETVRTSVPVLGRAAGVLGTAQIRSLGTLGGNLANASPSAEFGPPLLVLEASVRCLGIAGERSIEIGDFFVAPGNSALRPNEVITEVIIPIPPRQSHCVYLKHSLRQMDVAIAGAAVFVQLDGDVCRDVRIALGAVGPTPFRARQAEQALRGRRIVGDSAESELILEVAQAASAESSPIDDLREVAAYRRRIVGMMVKQGIEQAIARTRQ